MGDGTIKFKISRVATILFTPHHLKRLSVGSSVKKTSDEPLIAETKDLASVRQCIASGYRSQTHSNSDRQARKSKKKHKWRQK